MFNITGGEIIILMLLALIVLGPDKLPDFVRKAGRFYGEVKKMTGGFQSEFRSAIDEPLREMRDTANIARTWFEEGRSESDIDEAGDPGLVVTDETAAIDEVPLLDDEELTSDDDEGGDDVDIADDWEDSDEGDEGDDDPNFYAEDGSLLDADSISRMIAEADGESITPEPEPPGEEPPRPNPGEAD